MKVEYNTGDIDKDFTKLLDYMMYTNLTHLYIKYDFAILAKILKKSENEFSYIKNEEERNILIEIKKLNDTYDFLKNKYSFKIENVDDNIRSGIYFPEYLEEIVNQKRQNLFLFIQQKNEN